MSLGLTCVVGYIVKIRPENCVLALLQWPLCGQRDPPTQESLQELGFNVHYSGTRPLFIMSTCCTWMFVVYICACWNVIDFHSTVRVCRIGAKNNSTSCVNGIVQGYPAGHCCSHCLQGIGGEIVKEMGCAGGGGGEGIACMVVGRRMTWAVGEKEGGALCWLHGNVGGSHYLCGRGTSRDGGLGDPVWPLWHAAHMVCGVGLSTDATGSPWSLWFWMDLM